MRQIETWPNGTIAMMFCCNTAERDTPNKNKNFMVKIGENWKEKICLEITVNVFHLSVNNKMGY